MRYDNWDVILFPEDSNIPIPEYRTACYLSRDEDGHELPTLRTYIGSLKPETPFRISVHHWGPPKLSPLMQQKQHKFGASATLTVQVIVDGSRLYHGSFELSNSSPQEIAFEQHSFRSSRTKEQPSSQAKQHLRFPRSDRGALLQSSAWQPRGTDNRIKVLLSEQLINDNNILGLDQWDLVCFSFQHAPRDLLEQAGIAYPVLDPLRALVAEQATVAAPSASRGTIVQEPLKGSHMRSETSPESGPEPVRPLNAMPHQQRSTRMPSSLQIPPQLMAHRGGGRPGIYSDPYGSFGDPDSVSMRSFPSQRHASNMSGLESFYDPAFLAQTAPPWTHNATIPGQLVNPTVNSKRQRKDADTPQIMMALRDDQFGQILEALSPSRAQRSKPNGLTMQGQSHRPPKMGALSVPVRPSSAALARTILNPNVSSRCRRPSSDQANSDVAAPSKHINKKDYQISRENTPIPFILAPQRLDSDVSMRAGSYASSLSKFERDLKGVGSKASSAHAPTTVKTRKEGLATEMDDCVGLDVRHHQNLLVTDPDQMPRSSHLEVIDVDAIDPGLTADLANMSPFKPSHKAGMSSVSSTGLLERQLYSALGEELGSFEQLAGNEMGPELAQASVGGNRSELSESTLPNQVIELAKRKRQGTLGGERDQSPIKKKERQERQAVAEDEDISTDMP